MLRDLILRKHLLSGMVILFCCFSISCQENSIDDHTDPVAGETDSEVEQGKDYKLPNIDLSHWKVTLPIGNPTEVSPPAILNYATNELLLKFMYNDSTDGSLVFYTYPQASTTNSSYSRTELREQMDPGSNNTNWTFEQGGKMRGTLSVPAVSLNNQGVPERVIIMQIHGRLTNEQRNRIGASDNNAPPVLKIYWDNGKIVVKTKELKNLQVDDTEILKTSSWKDDSGHTFSQSVGKNKFTLDVQASAGKLVVSLNDEETVVYSNVHLEKWNVFENYFKAGNYLMSTDSDAYSRVKYYTLEISH